MVIVVSGSIPYYIVKNSWGTDFGHGGYVYVRYGNNTCGKTYSLYSFFIPLCYDLIRILWY